MNADELKRTAILLSKLFACFPQSALVDVEMQQRGYLEAVKDDDIRDVEEAVARFQRGLAASENQQFCPSSAQLCIEVRNRRVMRLAAEREGTLARRLVPRLPASHFQNRYRSDGEDAG